ncbi:MAG TPA: hypothetical protein PKD53_00845 [Chloroflexaceae bacterium]|nr:hypothetical protein [Chloroflexaceae bacterium]
MHERNQPPRPRPRRAGPDSEERLETREAPPPREAEGADRPRPPRRPRAAPRRQTPGDELAAQLRGPEALRRAVLLQEILGPPVALRGEEAPGPR